MLVYILQGEDALVAGGVQQLPIARPSRPEKGVGGQLALGVKEGVGEQLAPGVKEGAGEQLAEGAKEG